MRPLREALFEDLVMTELRADETYAITGIYSFGRGLIKRNPIHGRETSYSNMARLRAGQIVMSKLNAWEGALAVVDESFSDSFVSPEYPVFSIDQQQANPSYIRHMIAWPALWDRLTPRGSMVRRKRTTPTVFLDTEVPLPGLGEQRRVAEKLDAAMLKVSQIHALRNHSEQVVRHLASTLFRSIRDLAPLSQVLQEASDFVTVHPETTYATAGILNRGRGLFLRPVISGSETKYSKYNRLHAGQFVYSKLFGWEGSLAVVPDRFEGVHVSHEFPTFNIDPTGADVEYMTHLARWTGLHDALKNSGTGMGSRRKRVNVDRLLATEVPMPSNLADQHRIARQLTLAHRALEASAAQTEQAEVLRKALLNAAFSGQL